MADTTTWTIKALLDWTKDYLERNGSSSARLDAEILLAHVMGWQRIQLYTEFEHEPTDAQKASYRGLIKERAQGRPVAYLIGRREFFSLDFAVSPDVLIPRPETEFLVVRAIDLLREENPQGADKSVLDIGTGSGAIAIALATQLTELSVTAIDISSEALEIARSNAVQHDVADRITFLQGDTFSPLEASNQFDVIVSNPPYIGQSERETLPRDVVDFEPQQALICGDEGLEMTSRIIAQGSQYLTENGWLLIESSPILMPRVQQRLAQEDCFLPSTVIRDLAGLDRVVVAQKAA